MIAAVDARGGRSYEFGFKIPVLARSNGEVVDGHLRLKAALKLNLSEVPVIPCDDWCDAQVKAFRLLVNRFGDVGATGTRICCGLKSPTSRPSTSICH